MKKVLSIFLVLCTLFAVFSTAGYAEEAAENNFTMTMQIGNPMMTVNGVEKEIDPGHGTVPVIINDRTLLPVRAVVEEIGGEVGWSEETQEVTLTYRQTEILLTVGSITAYLNGEAQQLDTAPAIINDRTMLPIRFIVESFGFDVNWDEGSSTVIITGTLGGEETSPEQPAIDTDEEPNTTDESTEGSKALVVYFSATGNTESMAQTIAETTGADIVKIVPEEPYTAEDLDYSNDDCRANLEQNDPDARPAIANQIENIEEYDTIFLGYPIWWGTMPKIINTFLDTYDLSGKTIMPFCTSGSSGITSSVNEIREICADADVKDGLRGSSSTTSAQIEQWMTDNNVVLGVTENEASEPSEGTKALVVYFSATGNTESMAQTIAETTGADIVKIVPEEPYTAEDLDYSNDDCRANLEQNDPDARPAIANQIENIEEYDTIFLGYPIWWGTMPKIINTFLDTYDMSGKTIMPFCTSGGSGITSSVNEIKEICPDADVKDGLRGSSSATSAQIEQWMADNDVVLEESENEVTEQE